MNAPSLRISRIASRRGWTLIELVIVIAILLVLVTITIGVTGSIKEKAKNAVCVHNLRHVGTAFMNYTSDYHKSVIRSQVGGANIEVGWTRLIVNKGYLPSNTPWKLLCCPIGKMPQSGWDSTTRYNPASPNLGAGDAWRWYTYGLNMCRIPNRATVWSDLEPTSGKACTMYELPLSKVEKASAHVLIADSSSGPADHWQCQAMERDNKRGVALRHGPKGARYANAVFLDGHVEALTRDRIIALGEGFNIPQQFIFEITD